MKALAIVQARMGSTRFPGKSLAVLCGRPILAYLFEQVSFCRQVDRAVLATTDLPVDDPLAAYGKAQGWTVFRGSEQDVLARYHDAAVAYGAEDGTAIVRLTGDDIFPDPHLIDGLLHIYQALAGRIDVVCTERSDRFPYGSGIELYSFRALQRAHREAVSPREREHVSPYLIKHPEIFRRIDVCPSAPLGGIPLSIDHPEDLRRSEALLLEMAKYAKPPFRLADILAAADGLSAQG